MEIIINDEFEVTLDTHEDGDKSVYYEFVSGVYKVIKIGDE